MNLVIPVMESEADTLKRLSAFFPFSFIRDIDTRLIRETAPMLAEVLGSNGIKQLDGTPSSIEYNLDESSKWVLILGCRRSYYLFKDHNDRDALAAMWDVFDDQLENEWIDFPYRFQLPSQNDMDDYSTLHWEMNRWCVEYFGPCFGRGNDIGRWVATERTFRFADEQDAILYKMRWISG